MEFVLTFASVVDQILSKPIHFIFIIIAHEVIVTAPEITRTAFRARLRFMAAWAAPEEEEPQDSNQSLAERNAIDTAIRPMRPAGDLVS
jgi:hypothetical protein